MHDHPVTHSEIYARKLKMCAARTRVSDPTPLRCIYAHLYLFLQRGSILPVCFSHEPLVRITYLCSRMDDVINAAHVIIQEVACHWL